MLEPSRFTRSGGLGAAIADQVADDKVLAEFAAGATLVLQGLHRTWPPLVDFAQQLSTDLGHPVQVNAYVTPASNRGFDPHYDVHDVLVLQVAGEKRWTIHPPVHEHPLADQPWTDHREAVAAQAQEPPAIDAVLRAGRRAVPPSRLAALGPGAGRDHDPPDRRHARHDPVRPPAGPRRAGRRRARSCARPCRSACRADRPETLQADLDATVKALTDRLTAATASDAADAVRRRLDRTTRPEPIGPLAQATAAETAAGHTVVRLRRHTRARLAERAGDRLGPGHHDPDRDRAGRLPRRPSSCCSAAGRSWSATCPGWTRPMPWPSSPGCCVKVSSYPASLPP